MNISLLGTAALILLVVVLYILSKKYRPIARLYSPLSMGIAGALLLLTCLVMGLVRQEELPGQTGFLTEIGMRSIQDSAWMIGLVLLCMIICGMKGIWELEKHPTRLRYFLWIGIFVTLLGLLMGSYQMERYQMTVWKGNPSWMTTGKDKRNLGKEKRLPFAIELQDFRIDYHPPRIFAIERYTGMPLPEGKPQSMILDQTGSQKGSIMDWNIHVTEFLPQAWTLVENGKFFCKPSQAEGNCPAVRVDVKPTDSDTLLVSGWVSSGSMLMNPAYLELEDSILLCMGKLVPENYTATVKVYTMDGEKAGKIITDSIQPNRPLRIYKPLTRKSLDYQIYLKSYKDSHGFWNPYVDFEIIRDPWRSVVDYGILMILTGLLSLFISGLFPQGLFPRKNNGQKTETTQASQSQE